MYEWVVICKYNHFQAVNQQIADASMFILLQFMLSARIDAEVNEIQSEAQKTPFETISFFV